MYLLQFYFSEELRAMEIGFGERNRLPTEEMRFLGLIRALIEINFQFLREGRLLVSEDQIQWDTEFHGPFEQTVFLFKRFS